MKKPIIGIVGRPGIDKDEYPLISVTEPYRRAVLKGNGIPLLVLPTQTLEYENIRPKEMPLMNDEEKSMLIEILDKCDGIIIPGGFKWYEYDRFICDYAIRKDKPLLALCLGMQLLSSYNSEYNLEKNEDKGIDHFQKKVQYVHKVDIVNGTKLKSIVGDINNIEVNSCHNYHVVKPNDFVVSAYSPDGLIECLELPNKKFVMGFQWHLEVMVMYDEINEKIFKAFIDSCQE